MTAVEAATTFFQASNRSTQRTCGHYSGMEEFRVRASFKFTLPAPGKLLIEVSPFAAANGCQRDPTLFAARARHGWAGVSGDRILCHGRIVEAIELSRQARPADRKIGPGIRADNDGYYRKSGWMRKRIFAAMRTSRASIVSPHWETVGIGTSSQESVVSSQVSPNPQGGSP